MLLLSSMQVEQTHRLRQTVLVHGELYNFVYFHCVLYDLCARHTICDTNTVILIILFLLAYQTSIDNSAINNTSK